MHRPVVKIGVAAATWTRQLCKKKNKNRYRSTITANFDFEILNNTVYLSEKRNTNL